jgi:hypothetical protein
VVLERRQIKLDNSTHTLIETNPPIIKMEVTEGEFVEVGTIEKVHKINLELSNGKPFCILLDTSAGYFNISPQANELLASPAYALKRIATAIIVKTLATRLMGNFFIRFNKPPTPTRLFKTEEEAMTWLLRYKEI